MNAPPNFPAAVAAETPPLWYVQPEALAVLAEIRANPIEAVNHERWYTMTRDQWQSFTGTAVVRLERMFNIALDRAEHSSGEAGWRAVHAQGNAQDVIAAATGTFLHGIHWNSDMERLAAIGGVISNHVEQANRRAA